LDAIKGGVIPNQFSYARDECFLATAKMSVAVQCGTCRPVISPVITPHEPLAIAAIN
jgi:hypothetical protein